jgi:two-component system, OmpR family, phosphate regulon sensor histidine kinase PhoR
VGTINDVTEEVEALSALTRARRAAEWVRADVEARNEELRSLARAKDVMLAAVSHEFRTPLTSISTFVQMLAVEEGLDKRQQQAIGVILRNTERLEHLVADLLNARDAPVALEVSSETVDLCLLINDAVEMALPRAQERAIELSADAGSPVWGWADPKRMAQVIDGLVDNALKFTRAGGEIAMRVSDRGDRAQIEVSDSGVGIDEREIPRIFDRFYQGEAGRDSGHGSGLSIIKRLLDAQGATIEARSKLGEGTTMLVGIPAAPAR